MAAAHSADRPIAPQDAERLAWVDVAKGLCIVLVVMMHSTLGAGEALDGDADGALAAFGLHLALALVEPYSTLWFIYLLAVFSVVTKAMHRRVPPMLLLIGAAGLQMLPHHDLPTLPGEFCARYVYFLAGWLFAERIFAFAHWVRGHVGVALAGLALWAVVEAAFAFAPTGAAAYPTWASLPAFSLVLGSLGAMAIVAVAALMTRAGGPVTAAVRACGRRSIVIYLAFFLPMALTRTGIAKLAPGIDVGLASLIVTAAAVVTPLLVERAVRGGSLGFLFARPAAFHIAAPPRGRAALQAA